MRRKVRLAPALALLCCAGILSGCATQTPGPNLTLYKRELVQWHNRGAYAADVERAVRPAMAHLEGIAKQPAILRQNAAIVLDIDETSLSNWPYLVAGQFVLAETTFAPWVQKNQAAALPPTLLLFQKARAAGIPVFFITGRPESLRRATERQLHTLGYGGYQELFMRPDVYPEDSIIPFKSGVRRDLAESGWRILLNMGDQWSDLEGGFADKAVKLPNPFYYID